MLASEVHGDDHPHSLHAAHVFIRLVLQTCFDQSGTARSSTGSDRLIKLLKRLAQGTLGLPDLTDAVAASGHLAAMVWLRNQQTQLPCSASTCAAAARSGSVPMLRFLRSQEPPCPWDSSAYVEACQYGHIALLDCLRQNGCPWFVQCYLDCLQAAQHAGKDDVIRWLASQDPPTRWTPACCLKASRTGIMAALPWLAAGCPFKWTRKHCRLAARQSCDTVLEGIVSETQSNLSKSWATRSPGACNLQSTASQLTVEREITIAAAQCGDIKMLQWLWTLKPQRWYASQALLASLEHDQPAVMQYILTTSKISLLMPDLHRAAPHAFFAWTKAGRSMCRSNLKQVQGLVESWYVFLGLVRWTTSHDIPGSYGLLRLCPFASRAAPADGC